MTGNAWLYKHKRVINLNGSVLSIDKYQPAGSFVRMARKLRVEYEGAIYHVMNRGDRREAVFRDADDRELFLRTLAEACRKTDWQVHAYCLMSNHFHLVVDPRATWWP